MAGSQTLGPPSNAFSSKLARALRRVLQYGMPVSPAMTIAPTSKFDFWYQAISLLPSLSDLLKLRCIQCGVALGYISRDVLCVPNQQTQSLLALTKTPTPAGWASELRRLGMHHVAIHPATVRQASAISQACMNSCSREHGHSPGRCHSPDPQRREVWRKLQLKGTPVPCPSGLLSRIQRPPCWEPQTLPLTAPMSKGLHITHLFDKVKEMSRARTSQRYEWCFQKRIWLPIGIHESEVHKQIPWGNWVTNSI